jgi:hypothetical protein
MIIDVHTHAYPDKLLPKVRENLESLFKVKFYGDGSLKSLLEYMDKAGVNISVVCSVATRPEQVPSINDWLFSIRGERIRVFCALHPEYPDWEKELARIKEKGDGIKLQPEFQDFYVDDEKVFPLYEELEHLELPVLFHCGEELSGTQLVRSSPSRIARVLKQFPRLKLIAAHFGGFRLWDEVEEYLLGKEVYFDTAFFFGHLPPERIKYLILKHPEDKILFGTDFPLQDPRNDINFLESLDISERLKRRILGENARGLLKKGGEA